MTGNEPINNFLLNISTNIFLEITRYGKITNFNTKAGIVFALSSQKDISLDNVFPPETKNLFEHYIKNVLYQNYADNFHFEYQYRFYNAFVYPYKGNIVFCMEDITERRQLSHHLHQTKQRLEFAEKTAQLGYWELDLERRRFYWSAEMYRIFGVNTGQISLKKNLIREQIFTEDLPLYKQKLAELIKGGRQVEGQIRIRRADNNEEVFCIFKAGLIHYRHKKQIAGTFQNITPLIRIQQQLMEARNRADRMNLDKSYFLAQASHDLRQPLQALNLFVSALDNENNPDKQKEIILKIKESSENLKYLLDNLLDISKLDAGGMDFTRETFDLKNLLLKLGREYTEIANNKKICFKLIGEHFDISNDALLIERIIRNFLNNALKYTSNKIILSCFKYHKKIVIRVLDNGFGINEEEINNIFDDFYQSRHIPENRKKGAGLGLSIVKKITGLIAGKVKVRSRPECYTSFSLILNA